MTMTRSEKNGRTGILKKILGGDRVQAQSPRLRAEMTADHGSPTYTPKAWREQRMGRGQMDTGRLDLTIEKRRTVKIQSRRKTTRTI